MNDEWRIPNLGRAPTEYDPLYVDNIVRQLTVVLASMHASGDVDAASLLLRRVPTTPIGYPTGTVYNADGFLKLADLALFPAPPAGGLVLTGYVPSVFGSGSVIPDSATLTLSGFSPTISSITSAITGITRRVLAQSSRGHAHTGDTNETTLTTVNVDAGDIGLNGSLVISSVWSYNNNSNDKTPRVRFGAAGASATHSGIAYLDMAFSFSKTYAEIRTISNRNSLTRQKGMAGDTFGGIGTSESILVTSSIDTTAATEIEFSAELAVASDSVRLEFYSIELYSDLEIGSRLGLTPYAPTITVA